MTGGLRNMNSNPVHPSLEAGYSDFSGRLLRSSQRSGPWCSLRSALRRDVLKWLSLVVHNILINTAGPVSLIDPSPLLGFLSELLALSQRRERLLEFSGSALSYHLTSKSRSCLMRFALASPVTGGCDSQDPGICLQILVRTLYLAQLSSTHQCIPFWRS